MLISLPARAPTVLIHLLPRSPPLLTSPSTCLYAHSPALSLLHSTSHAAADEASDTADAVQSRKAAGYGGEKDMDREIGA